MRKRLLYIICILILAVFSIVFLGMLSKTGSSDKFGNTITYTDNMHKIPEDIEGEYELAKSRSLFLIIQPTKSGSMIFDYDFFITKGKIEICLQTSDGKEVFKIIGSKNSASKKTVQLMKRAYQLVLTLTAGSGRYHVCWQEK